VHNKERVRKEGTKVKCEERNAEYKWKHQVFIYPMLVPGEGGGVLLDVMKTNGYKKINVQEQKQRERKKKLEKVKGEEQEETQD
jgi:hypothetical protein